MNHWGYNPLTKWDNPPGPWARAAIGAAEVIFTFSEPFAAEVISEQDLRTMRVLRIFRARDAQGGTPGGP